jgi:uncharacterized Zn-binding protein involved in type VI secretion
VPAAARLDDPGIPHCSGYVIRTASTDVYINDRGAARLDDLNTVHFLPGAPCPAHSVGISQASRSVYINDRGAARVGDPFESCTRISAGSDDVFIGD